MRFIILLSFILIPLFADAQPGWLKGYIVTNASDTLYGKILYSTPGMRSARCMFKEDGYNDKVKYKPFTIKGYFVNDQYYVSRIYDIHPSLTYGLGVFMEYVNVGESPVMILKYRNTNSEMGFNQIFLVKKGNPSYEIDPMKFKKTTASFFSDYKKLQSDIESGMYKMKDLPNIVKRYNAWYRNK